MSDIIYNLKSKIRYSSFGNKFVEDILGTRTGDIIYKICDKSKLTDISKQMINPPEVIINELNSSKLFFSNNVERLEKICESLEDEKSKKVYRQAIRFRQTLAPKDRPSYTAYDQYFVKNIINLNCNEVFIDCGAFTGDSTQRFIKECNGKYKKIVAFEPDNNNCKIIEMGMFHNCIIINAGVWNETTTLKFHKINDKASSKMEGTKTIGVNADDSIIESVHVQSIDETECCNDCTYIKMDIEGSEMNALLGAQKTIMAMRPKLAICIYHNDEDMLRIPEWILGLNLDYKLFIRHHFGTRSETVLYAIPK